MIAKSLLIIRKSMNDKWTSKINWKSVATTTSSRIDKNFPMSTVPHVTYHAENKCLPDVEATTEDFSLTCNWKEVSVGAPSPLVN